MEYSKEEDRSSGDATTSDSCEGCALAKAMARRAFLRDAALATAAIFATLGVASSEARAMPVRLASALSTHEDERTYPIPNADGATIDKEESVIVVRWQGSVYVF